MVVGLYFPVEHLGKWSWSEFLRGELAVSGTDAAQLYLLEYLAESKRFNPVVFTGSTFPKREGLRTMESSTLPEAVQKANRDAAADVLVSICRDGQDTFLSGLRTATRQEVPLLIWCQNHPSPETLDVMAEEPGVRRIVCVSKSEADDLRHHPAFRKTEVVYNGVDSAPFDKAIEATERSPHRVCFLGALTPAKGFHHVARAWPKVRRTFPEAELHVMGSAKLYDRDQSLGPLGIAEDEFEREEIIPHLGKTRSDARSLGVHFLGLVPPHEVRETIASSLIGIVNPNVAGSIETFCVSAVEIQAGGAAVVGAQSGGLRETVQHSKTGYLIRDESELSDALCKLLGDPYRTKQMGERGRQHVRKTFGLKRYRRRWRDVLQRVRKGKPPSPPSFSWRRATYKTFARELVRRSRKWLRLGEG